MTKTLLDEFEKYEKIINCELEIDDAKILSTTVALPLICNGIVEMTNINSIIEIDSKNPNMNFEEKIFDSLNVTENNRNLLFFVFHELTNNIYDHSRFTKGFVMGKTYPQYCEIGFIDNGISIPISLKNANYSFENDCEAIIKAINGLSTKNEFGFVERGTGLNNTINIVKNGCSGSVLIASGNGLIYMGNENIYRKDISNNPLQGTLVCLRLDLTRKVDIYNYLNPITL